ncbi:BON domain-containing protein [Pseudomonas caspiana]
MNDLSLRNNILDELDFRPDINPANIGVMVKDGVVTLTGHVGTYAEKIAAERAVTSIKGVRAIAQEIEVRPASQQGVTDDMIAARAANIISWTAHLPDGAIKIKVQAGWVNLEGQVDWQYERDSILRAVHKLSGVVGVTNMITLRPRPNAIDIKQRIEDALKRSAEVDARQIRVKVEGDTVKLEGKIHMLGERTIVERAAWATPGVRRVEDHLMLG